MTEPQGIIRSSRPGNEYNHGVIYPYQQQAVARSSRVTSSRKKWLPDSGAFFHSGASGFATCAKPAPAGDFPLRSDVVGTYDSPTNAPSLFLATRFAKNADPLPDPQAESTGNDQKSPESSFYLLSPGIYASLTFLYYLCHKIARFGSIMIIFTVCPKIRTLFLV